MFLNFNRTESEKNLDEYKFSYDVSLSNAVFATKYAVALEDVPPVLIGEPKQDTGLYIKSKAKQYWNDTISNAEKAIEESKTTYKKALDEYSKQMKDKMEFSRGFIQKNGNAIAAIDQKFITGGILTNFSSYIFQLKSKTSLNEPIFSVINNYFAPKKDLIEKGQVAKELIENYKESFKKSFSDDEDFDEKKVLKSYTIQKNDWKTARQLYGKDFEQNTRKAIKPVNTFMEKMYKYMDLAISQLSSNIIKAFSPNATDADKSSLERIGNSIKSSISLLKDANQFVQDIFRVSNDLYGFSANVIESSVEAYNKDTIQKKTEVEDLEKSHNLEKKVSNF